MNHRYDPNHEALPSFQHEQHGAFTIRHRVIEQHGKQFVEVGVSMDTGGARIEISSPDDPSAIAHAKQQAIGHAIEAMVQELGPSPVGVVVEGRTVTSIKSGEPAAVGCSGRAG